MSHVTQGKSRSRMQNTLPYVNYSGLTDRQKCIDYFQAQIANY